MPATLVVANLRSGGGRARDTLPLVTGVLRRAGHEHELIVVPSAEETATLLAAALRSSRQEFDRVIVLGGDGTIGGAVNGIVASGVTLPLGIVPCGTGNEIMRSLGLPKNPEKAAQVCLRGRVVPIDVGKVNGRYFLNTFGLGADVEVVKIVNTLRARYRFARVRSVYYLAALLLISSGFEPFFVEVQVGDRVFRGKAVMIAAANGRIYGERLPALPSPSLTDGLLDLYLLQELGSRRLRKTARLLRRLPVPELSVQRCSEVTIRLDQRREAQVDGGLIGPRHVFELSLLPQRIAVIHPAPPVLSGEAPRPTAAARAGGSSERA
ncbi:MAG TPA: YegS/Rv2252/BmrU family lipid kinase [bacterium]|nr:YegS/Rv2252/BmrU family lipid kinase [bacterium]